MTEQNLRLRKIIEIMDKMLTVHIYKRCTGYCHPMHDGRFLDYCKDCAYFDLTKELNELKAEVGREGNCRGIVIDLDEVWGTVETN